MNRQRFISLLVFDLRKGKKPMKKLKKRLRMLFTPRSKKQCGHTCLWCPFVEQCYSEVKGVN